MSNENERIANVINTITDANYKGNGEFIKFEDSYDSLRGKIGYRLRNIEKETKRKFQLGVMPMPNFNTVWFVYDRQKVWQTASEETRKIETETAETAR